MNLRNELTRTRAQLNKRNRKRTPKADNPAPPPTLEDCCRLGYPWALDKWQREHGRPWGSHIAAESARPSEMIMPWGRL